MPRPLLEDSTLVMLQRYERGTLKLEEIAELFQRLLDTSLIHFMSRRQKIKAEALIEAGVITEPYPGAVWG